MTGLELICAALRLIGVLATGETPSANEANDALTALNDLIDSWSTENLLIVAKVVETFPLVVNQQVYTIGVGGNFSTARPQLIEHAAIQVLSNNPVNEIPVDIINLDQWSDIQVKSVTSSIPLRLYNDDNYPLSNLSLWPVPSVANNITLYSWKPISEIASLTTIVSLPPGYSMALKYNLAVALSAEYGKEPTEIVLAGAIGAKANIKRMNIKPILMGTDAALASNKNSFNWLTGE